MTFSNNSFNPFKVFPLFLEADGKGAWAPMSRAPRKEALLTMSRAPRKEALLTGRVEAGGTSGG